MMPAGEFFFLALPVREPPAELLSVAYAFAHRFSIISKTINQTMLSNAKPAMERGDVFNGVTSAKCAIMNKMVEITAEKKEI